MRPVKPLTHLGLHLLHISCGNGDARFHSSATWPRIKMISSELVNRDQFAETLAQYPAVIEAASSSKDAKPGQKTLVELDDYRYGDALVHFGQDPPGRQMDLETIKLLVEWKLRHGKFRPTLMSLVSSNTPEVARKTVQEAIALYKKEEDVDKAVGVLTNLRGVGPATASLLLTVHDPTRVIFFSDEAFHWLCCEGKKAPIKYNAKEYRQLRLRADELANRLGVSATDIEKVSYVLMKQSAAGLPVVSKDRQDIPIGSVSVSEKRKTASDPDLAPTELSLRRSKRTKA